jgi:hypothetical protein
MITAGLTNSFKEELLLGVHDFSSDTFKIALYTSSADLGPNTPVYTAAGEVSGTGYTAAGNVLTGALVSLSLLQGIAYVTFDNPYWNAATFTTRGALIYNSTKGNKSVAVLNFGLDQTVLSQQFLIQLPANNADTSFIRVD